LNTKNIRPGKIHYQFVEVHGEGVMNEGNVCKWCRLLHGGRSDVHNEAQSGRPSVITKDLKDRVAAHTCEKRLFTIDKLHDVFPYVSRSLLYKIVTVLSPKLKKLLGSKWMTIDEVKETVMDSLNGLVANFYEEGIVKLVQHLDKC
jgi:hypothetical protein